jgi:hypothetical protein
MRGSIMMYWLHASFLAVSRSLSSSTGVVPLTTWSFLVLLQFFLLGSLDSLTQRKLRVSAICQWGTFAIAIYWHETFHVFIRSFMLMQLFTPHIISRAPPCFSHGLGCLHFRRINHVVVPLSSPDASCRSRIGLFCWACHGVQSCVERLIRTLKLHGSPAGCSRQ